jgi:Carboxypeptidase regulatory-like domain
MGWHVRQIRQCWCGSQTVGSAPDEDRLNNVGAGRDGVQCSPFRSQKGNFGLNVFPTQPGTKGAMNSKRVFLAVLALAISFSTTKVAAQSLTTGSISGAVTDPSNALIPKAQVTLKDNSKGTTQETKTNASGLYEFALLAPSSYTVTVSAAGFQVVNRTANVVLGQATMLNIQMTVGAADMTITVTEVAPLIQTDNGNLVSTINETQVSQIPQPWQRSDVPCGTNAGRRNEHIERVRELLGFRNAAGWPAYCDVC